MKILFTAVLLHIGNDHPAIPIAHSTALTEKYETMNLLLDRIGYKLHRWKVCCDLKVVQILMGLKSAYTKNQCFLCLFEGRSKQNTYAKKVWPRRKEFIFGKESVIHSPLIFPWDVILPPLHIKLGLIYSFIYHLAKMFKQSEQQKQGKDDIDGYESDDSECFEFDEDYDYEETEMDDDHEETGEMEIESSESSENIDNNDHRAFKYLNVLFPKKSQDKINAGMPNACNFKYFNCKYLFQYLFEINL